MCHTLRELSESTLYTVLGKHSTISLFDCKRDAIAVLLFDFSQILFLNLSYSISILVDITSLYAFDSSCLTFTGNRSVWPSYIFEHFMDRKTERQIS